MSKKTKASRKTNAELNRARYTTLANMGVDTLLTTRDVCAAEGVTRETLSRRVSRGEFTKPDRVMNGRNYWYLSTLKKAQAALKKAQAAAEVENDEAAEDEARRCEDGDEEEAEAETPEAA